MPGVTPTVVLSARSVFVIMRSAQTVMHDHQDLTLSYVPGT